MSYMNDDCDPFGVPYSGKSGQSVKEKEYSLEELQELRAKELKLNQTLYDIKKEKEKAEKQLKKEISKYIDPNAKIVFDKHINCKIITTEFELSKLEKLKDNLDLKDVEVRIEKVENKLNGNYEDKIIIRLRSYEK